jgi:hypothetical protein
VLGVQPAHHRLFEPQPEAVAAVRGHDRGVVLPGPWRRALGEQDLGVAGHRAVDVDGGDRQQGVATTGDHLCHGPHPVGVPVHAAVVEVSNGHIPDLLEPRPHVSVDPAVRGGEPVICTYDHLSWRIPFRGRTWFGAMTRRCLSHRLAPCV